MQVDDVNVDAWEQARNFMYEMESLLAGAAAASDLNLGELSSVFTAIATGANFVEDRALTLLALVERTRDLMAVLPDVPSWVNAALAAIPDEMSLNAAQAHLAATARRIVETQTVGRQVRQQLHGALIGVADTSVAALLETLAKHTEALYLDNEALRRALESYGAAIATALDIVDRREFLSEQMAAVEPQVDAAFSAVSTLNAFMARFGGATGRSIAGPPAAVDAPACDRNFLHLAQWDVPAAVDTAQATLAQLPRSIEDLRAVSDQLPALVRIAEGQQCVTGSLCGLATVSAQLQEADAMLGAVEDGLAALIRIGDNVADVGESAAAVQECMAGLPAAIVTVDAFVEAFVEGQASSGGAADPQAVVDELTAASLLVNQGPALADAVGQTVASISDRLDDIRSAVGAGAAATTTAIDTLNIGLKWVEDTQSLLPDLQVARQHLTTYNTAYNAVATGQDNFAALSVPGKALLGMPIVRSVPAFQRIAATGVTLLEDLGTARDMVIQKRELLQAAHDVLWEQSGVGLPLDTLTPWNKLPHCSDPSLPNGVCMRNIGRSTKKYRDFEFTSSYTRFWYETIPAAFGNSNFKNVRCGWS